jgi:hypothetical protein
MSVFRIPVHQADEAVIKIMQSILADKSAFGQLSPDDPILEDFVKKINGSEPQDYHTVFEHFGLSTLDVYNLAVETKYENAIIPFIFKMRLRGIANGLELWDFSYESLPTCAMAFAPIFVQSICNPKQKPNKNLIKEFRNYLIHMEDNNNDSFREQVGIINNWAYQNKNRDLLGIIAGSMNDEI